MAVLPGEQTKSGTQILCFGEVDGFAHGGDQGGSIPHANAGDRCQPCDDRVIARQFDKLAVQGLDHSIEFAPSGTQFAYHLARTR